MKKLIAILCMAAVMVSTVFAAGSPIKTDITTDGKIYDVNGNDITPEGVKVEVQGLNADQVKLANDKFGDNELGKLKVLFTDLTVNGNIMAYRFDVYVTPDEKKDQVLALLPFQIKFFLPDTFNKDTDKVIGVAHYSDALENWEKLDNKANGNEVMAKFTTEGKLSPVIIFVERSQKATGEGGGKVVPGPKTGEPVAIAVAGVVAIAAFVGMVVTRRKEN